MLKDGAFFVQSLYFSTKPAAPDSPVSGLREFSSSSTTLFVAFAPAVTTGPNMSFIIRQTDLVLNETVVYSGSFGDNVGPAPNTVAPSLICEAATMVLFTFNLVPNTNYQFIITQVCACLMPETIAH